MPPLVPSSKLLWVHKTARSSSLSHSDDLERIQVFSQAQRTSRLSKKQEQLRQRLQAIHVPPTPRPALGLDPTCSSQERRAIAFYQAVTVTKIMVPPDEMIFWRDDVLCLTQWCPPFRHLVAAIGASHEVLVSPDAVRLNVFALEQSSLAARILRESACTNRGLLIASCVLISAYNLLRCDLATADRSIEAGLRLASSPDESPSPPRCRESEYTYWYNGDLLRLLQLLDFRNSHRLWAPDVSFEFEKVQLGDNALLIDPDCVKGPFVDLDQAIDSYKALTNEAVSKMLRNMAVSAYVDPFSAVSQEISRQLSLFNFYWDMYFASLAEKDVGLRLEMLSLRAAAYNIYLLFRSRVICPDELATEFDPHIHAIRHSIIEIAEYVLEARHAGQQVEYFDRFVNRSLWALALYAFDDALKRKIGMLLRDQMDLEHGLINWLRGTIVTMVADVEKQRQEMSGRLDILISNRIMFRNFFYCESDNEIVLDYGIRQNDGQVEQMQHRRPFDLVATPAPTPDEIETTLQQILAGYRMFGKPSLAEYPRGYARPMFYQDKQIPVFPGPVDWSIGPQPS